MRALLSLYVCFATTVWLAGAADVPTLVQNQTDVVAESEQERMMPIPEESSWKSMFETMWLKTVKLLNSYALFEEFQVRQNAMRTLESSDMVRLMKLFSKTPKDVRKLSQYFIKKYGDGVMAETLFLVKKSEDEATSEIAATLLEHQLEGYLQQKPPLSGDKVFEKLWPNIDNFGYDDEKLSVLEEYIQLFNKKKSGDVTLPQVLASVMGGEDRLIASLTMAKNADFSRSKALDVESSLVKKWKKENLHPRILLTRLKIRHDLNKLKTLDAVMQYIQYYNHENPNQKFSLLTWLTETMEEDVVALKLHRAKGVADTEKIATALQEEQFEKWLEDQEPVVYVVKMLKMEKMSDLDKNKVQLLEDFIAFFNKKRAGNETLLKALTSGMGGEAKLLENLKEAEKDPLARTKALEVESMLVMKWIGEEELNPEILVRRLEIEQSMKTQKSLRPVVEYIAEYNKKHASSEFSLVSWVTKTTDEGVAAEALSKAMMMEETESTASTLRQEQFENWHARGKSADDVFELLKIKDIESNVFASLRVETLKAYINFLNKKKKNPQGNPPGVFSVLLKGLGDAKFVIKLLETIDSASPEGKGFYNARLLALFDHWFDSGVDSSKLRTWFKKPDENDVHRVKFILSKYEAFYQRKMAKNGRRVRFALDQPQ
ncbi:hypothetical protein PsorP6_006591 [Peronosclerospora sorghi]|uniref:Uncharacterized protein n=1 Tax=Peronosclerospora sorghi TaxID=230839 RepID=A0ACC0W126_9STRA|nr:hypothetical protein PsorP6_006591 [Peronosclerospora sorghi]